MFNPRPGRGSNRRPQDWEAEIFTTAPTPPLGAEGVLQALHLGAERVLQALHLNLMLTDI